MVKKVCHLQKDLDRLLIEREKIADLILRDKVLGRNYIPIFKRLDNDVKNAKAALTGSVIDRVRAMSNQRDMS
jgi:hypothetical protein